MDAFVADLGGPAKGSEHGVIEVVVQPAQDSDESAPVNLALPVAERLADAQLG